MSALWKPDRPLWNSSDNGHIQRKLLQTNKNAAMQSGMKMHHFVGQVAFILPSRFENNIRLGSVAPTHVDRRAEHCPDNLLTSKGANHAFPILSASAMFLVHWINVVGGKRIC